MINNRHEKAILITAAYVVGFATAFIAFGISNYNSAELAYQGNDVEFAPVEASIDPDQEYLYETRLGTAVAYEGGILSVSNDEHSFVLSLLSSVVPEEEKSNFIEQGLHVSTPAYLTSPDGRFVYFCEQHDESISECQVFIFDSEKEVTYFVTNDAGEKIRVTIEEAHNAVWDDNILSVGQHISVSNSSPWKVAEANL